jgi:hypothetical protein
MHLASVRKEALENAKAKIVIVGCGEWNPIVGYAGSSNAYHPATNDVICAVELTGFEGPILADPSRNLYRMLGMTEHMAGTPAGVPKKSYLTEGTISNILNSIWVTNPVDAISLQTDHPLLLERTAEEPLHARQAGKSLPAWGRVDIRTQ